VNSKSVRVLIVDDNPDFLFTMETFLKKNGYLTATAGDGKSALNVIRTMRPDVVLLDIMMETMFSGFEVCREIRKDPDLRDTPIIGISGMTEELGILYEKYPDHRYFSPDAFIDKPVNKPHLLTQIREVLRLADIRKGMPEWQKELEEAQLDKII